MFGKKKKSDKELNIQEQNIKVQEESWAREKVLLERQYKMQEERKNLRTKTKGKITTTKWIVAFLFLNCTAIEIFTGWATYESLKISMMLGTYADFTPLVALIGAVVGEVMGFAVYAAKSTKENTVGGVVYDQVMKNSQPNIEEPEKEPNGNNEAKAAG